MTESLPVVLLVGGMGTRLGQTGETPPKALVQVGDKPILWHVMKIYAAYGHAHFILPLGYRGDWIRRYFMEYSLMSRPLSFTLGETAAPEFHAELQENHWRLTLFEAGLHTNKGARIAKAQPYIAENTLFVTYGDGVGNVDVDALLAFHRSHGKLATVTGVQPFSQYGVMNVTETGQVMGFYEKEQLDQWINAGFFVFERGVFNYLRGDDTLDLERQVLPRLAADGQLMMYKHTGFWASMDTFKEAQALTELWESGQAPWQVWK